MSVKSGDNQEPPKQTSAELEVTKESGNVEDVDMLHREEGDSAEVEAAEEEAEEEVSSDRLEALRGKHSRINDEIDRLRDNITYVNQQLDALEGSNESNTQRLKDAITNLTRERDIASNQKDKLSALSELLNTKIASEVEALKAKKEQQAQSPTQDSSQTVQDSAITAPALGAPLPSFLRPDPDWLDSTIAKSEPKTLRELVTPGEGGLGGWVGRRVGGFVDGLTTPFKDEYNSWKKIAEKNFGKGTTGAAVATVAGTVFGLLSIAPKAIAGIVVGLVLGPDAVKELRKTAVWRQNFLQTYGTPVLAVGALVIGGLIVAPIAALGAAVVGGVTGVGRAIFDELETVGHNYNENIRNGMGPIAAGVAAGVDTLKAIGKGILSGAVKGLANLFKTPYTFFKNLIVDSTDTKKELSERLLGNHGETLNDLFGTQKANADARKREQAFNAMDAESKAEFDKLRTCKPKIDREVREEFLRLTDDERFDLMTRRIEAEFLEGNKSKSDSKINSEFYNKELGRLKAMREAMREAAEKPIQGASTPKNVSTNPKFAGSGKLANVEQGFSAQQSQTGSGVTVLHQQQQHVIESSEGYNMGKTLNPQENPCVPFDPRDVNSNMKKALIAKALALHKCQFVENTKQNSNSSVTQQWVMVGPTTADLIQGAMECAKNKLLHAEEYDLNLPDDAQLQDIPKLLDAAGAGQNKVTIRSIIYKGETIKPDAFKGRLDNDGNLKKAAASVQSLK